MAHLLKPHPDSPPGAVARIAVGAARPRAGMLKLHYIVEGAIGDLKIPERSAPARTDELWKHTCLEAFVRAPAGEHYCEFNFSPSTQWAAYRFTGYRKGMNSISEVATPQIEVQSAKTLSLAVTLDLSDLPELPPHGLWRVGISAIIEGTDGAKSYWALAHPEGKADFHHAAGFALDLPLQDRPITEQT